MPRSLTNDVANGSLSLCFSLFLRGLFVKRRHTPDRPTYRPLLYASTNTGGGLREEEEKQPQSGKWMILPFLLSPTVCLLRLVFLFPLRLCRKHFSSRREGGRPVKCGIRPPSSISALSRPLFLLRPSTVQTLFSLLA